MTQIMLHGILAREFGDTFSMRVENPKDILHAIDANRRDFIARIIELQKEGFLYEIIINKQRVHSATEMENHREPETIDLVPAITGSGLVAAASAIIGFLGSGTFLAAIAKAVLFAAISYALTPKPEVEQLEITAGASTQSLIFTNTVNVATQGAPVPVGYGRLKVGSQVIQASIKSFPRSEKTRDALNPGLGALNDINASLRTNKVTDQRFGRS